MRDPMNPEQPPSGPLYAPETPAGGASGTQRGSGAAPGAQTGSEGFDAPTPVAHATPCGPNVCGVVTHAEAAPAPEPGLRDRMAGRRGDYAAALAQSFAGSEGGRLERMTDAALAVRDRRMEQLAAGRETWKRKALEMEADRDRMLALLGEAVDWIPEGEMRERICAALNPQEQPPVNPPGSTVEQLPADDDPRGGEIGLAVIPSHITRDGRDDADDAGVPWPWLRLSIDVPGDDPAMVLSPSQARHLAAQLTDWADDADPKEQP